MGVREHYERTLAERGYASDPAQLRVIGSHEQDNHDEWAPGPIILGDGVAFVVGSYSGVTAFDVSDLTQPRRIAHIDQPDRGRDASLAGELLVLAQVDGGLNILRVTRGEAPTPGTPASPEPTASPGSTPGVRGPRAYLPALQSNRP